MDEYLEDYPLRVLTYVEKQLMTIGFTISEKMEVIGKIYAYILKRSGTKKDKGKAKVTFQPELPQSDPAEIEKLWKKTRDDQMKLSGQAEEEAQQYLTAEQTPI